MRDVLYLLRHLRRSPASAAAAVLTLALTLGAAASIFAIVDAVLLTPPPFADPERLAIVRETPVDQPGSTPRAVTYRTFDAWRDAAGPLAAIEAFDGTNLTLTGLGAAERLSATDATPGLLALLGVVPAQGRAFDAEDVGQPLAIISHRFWRARLAADPHVLGRTIVLGARPHTIVGVLPERFVFAFNASDIWRPLPMNAAQAARTGYRVTAMARLANSVSPAHLAAALDEASRQSSLPGLPVRVVVTPVSTAIAGDAPAMLALLAGSAALAMLIAFANLAGLLIVRAVDRRRELAVRTALGARWTEIARQLIVEAEGLVALGVAGGALLALWTTPVVASLALEQFGSVANREVAVSWRVLGAIGVIAAVAAAVCALLPAALAARTSVVEALRRGVASPPRERRLRRILVAGEVAVAFVLLVCVALLGGSLVRVLRLDPGFDPRGVLALQVSLPAASYPGADRITSFYTALQQALDERLGPRAASIVDEIPLTGDRGRSVVSALPVSGGHDAVVRTAAPAYFDVMRIPLVAGRGFETADNASAPRRVVISQSLASRVFGIESPIGRQVWISGTEAATVIGVAGDVRHRALDEGPAPTLYLSAAQFPSRSCIIVTRSSRPDADVLSAVRDEVARLDRDLPVYRWRSMQEVVAVSPGVPARRVSTATFVGFALLAVVLGAIGLFGVVAHDVAARRAELALRIALGADPGRLLSATLAQGMTIVGSGLVVGAMLSFWAVGALRSAKFGADRVDAVSLVAAAAMLAVVALAAILPAALRAARTDPLIALRSE